MSGPERIWLDGNGGLCESDIWDETEHKHPPTAYVRADCGATWTNDDGQDQGPNCGVCVACLKAQRDRLASALREWVKWTEDNSEQLKSMAIVAAVHGCPYQGGNYADALDKSTAALAEVDNGK